jgi:hypothetical protein
MYSLLLTILFVFLLFKFLTREIPPETSLDAAKRVLNESPWISESEMRTYMQLSNQRSELGSVSAAIVAKTADMYRRHVEKMMSYEEISKDDPDQANRVMSSLTADILAAKHAGMKISRSLVFFTPSSSNVKYWATVEQTQENARALLDAAQFLEE